MSLTAFVAMSLAFGAGVVVGVVLGEKGIVTTESIERSGKFIVDTTVAAGKKVKDAVTTPAPVTPSA